MGAVEDREHVLNTGDMGNVLRKKASIELGINYLASLNWWQQVIFWFRCARKTSQKGVIIGLLPILISWKLWRWRCLAKMEGKKESLESVWISIKKWLNLISGKEKCIRYARLQDWIGRF